MISSMPGEPLIDQGIDAIEETFGALGTPQRDKFEKLQNFNSRFVQKAAECGLNSFILMSGAIDGYQIKSKLLSYEGPFGVGYAVAKFDVIDDDKENSKLESSKHKEDPYVKVARESFEYYLHNNNKYYPKPDNLIEDLINNKAGVFVTIYKHNQLRGCVGTIIPNTGCIADEIIQNVINAGLHDPRFTPVRQKELSSLKYKVDVLLPPEPIKSFDELDIKRYGIIVSNNYKKGLLLPNIEGINSIEKQVNIAKMKAGIRENESYKMERFEVIRHH